MTFVKGGPKVAGRKAGTPNKRTVDAYKFKRCLHERLMDLGCNIDEELLKVIRQGNHEMVKAIQSLYPYIQPKFKDADPLPPEVSEKDDDSSTDSLLESLK
jgi:hypothetical protein